MKHTLFALLTCINVYANEQKYLQDELRDIPEEMVDYHTDRWPQFLVDFYQNMKQTLSSIKEQYDAVPEKIYLKLFSHPHNTEIAHARFTPTDDICAQEKEYVNLRSMRVKKQLEKLFSIKLDEKKIPRIGFIFSGGGFRAMFMTLGFLQGAYDTGLLDTTTYCTGLSGSTWALAPWIASKKNLAEYVHAITGNLENGVDHINDPYEIGQLFEIIITKLLCNQLISTMDLYGSVIANTLLKQFMQNPLLVRLTESHAHVAAAELPFPIYTAIQSSHDPYEWMEFTPFETGSSFLRCYIPTWAYGRKFKNGVSTTFSPEQTLGYFMGVFGSAFELSLKDIVRITASNIALVHYPLPGLLAQTIKKGISLIIDSAMGNARPFPSMLANFTYQCTQSPTCDHKTIELVDAGIDFNLPFPPLLRQSRAVDILVVCDASATVSGAPELKRAELYARRYGLKFPPIDYRIVDSNHISVWYDPKDTETPVIVYVPRLKNETFPVEFDPEECIRDSFCNTFNFTYTKDQARLLCGFGKHIIMAERQTIKDAIAYVLNRKYGYTVPVNPQLKPGFARQFADC